MNEQQLTALAGALMTECSAKTLTMLGEALKEAKRDPITCAGLSAVIDTARELRQQSEQPNDQALANMNFADALAQRRSGGRQ